MKNPFNKYIPPYSHIPLLLVVAVNFLVYYVSRLINAELEHHDISSSLDKALPFIPEFIVIYILAYFQWALCYILIARESRERCYYFLSGELIAKLICFLFFIFYPTITSRPEPTGFLTSFIFSADIPNNLFPSIHCLASYICFRGLIGAKKVGRGFKIINAIFSVLVFLSTVFVKQHFVIDIFGGVAAAEIGLLLARLLKTNRIFKKTNYFLSKRRGDNYYE